MYTVDVRVRCPECGQKVAVRVNGDECEPIAHRCALDKDELYHIRSTAIALAQHERDDCARGGA